MRAAPGRRAASRDRRPGTRHRPSPRRRLLRAKQLLRNAWHGPPAPTSRAAWRQTRGWITRWITPALPPPAAGGTWLGARTPRKPENPLAGAGWTLHPLEPATAARPRRGPLARTAPTPARRAARRTPAPGCGDDTRALGAWAHRALRVPWPARGIGGDERGTGSAALATRLPACAKPACRRGTLLTVRGCSRAMSHPGLVVRRRGAAARPQPFRRRRRNLQVHVPRRRRAAPSACIVARGRTTSQREPGCDSGRGAARRLMATLVAGAATCRPG